MPSFQAIFPRPLGRNAPTINNTRKVTDRFPIHATPSYSISPNNAAHAGKVPTRSLN
ncbi:hypothetical protein APED_03410 [Acanthopleuribacter pedis]